MTTMSRLGDAIGRVRDKLTTPAGVCLNVVGGAVMHRAKRVAEPRNDYFVIIKRCASNPPNSLEVGNST